MLYTAAFLAAAGLVFSYFFIYGKSFVWNQDGLYQHYNAFVYLGQWVRSILKTLLTEHTLEIPMWEFGIGYGADVITTLSYYVVGDPFALISVITPMRYAEWGYMAALLLRYYAAGMAFCMYAKKMGCGRFASVCASLMYVFCTYAVFGGVRHPFFITPMVFLPLIFLGAEKIIRGENPLCLILSVFTAAISNFYFFYMLVLLTVIYVVVRILAEKETRNGKTLLLTCLRVGGFALLGVGLSAFLLLPNLMNLLGTTRMTSAYHFDLLYSWKYYSGLAGNLMGSEPYTDWGYIGIAPLTCVGAGAALVRKNESRWAKWYLGLCVVFMMFPVFGYVFNGFSYVCGRWVFAWAFLGAFLFAKGFPVLLHMSPKEKLMLSAGCVIYSVLCLILEKSRSTQVLTGVVLLFICLLVLWGMELVSGAVWKKLRISRRRCCQIVTFALMLGSVFQISYYRYSMTESSYLTEFWDRGTVLSQITDQRAAALALIPQEEKEAGFFRVDNHMNSNKLANFLISQGQSSTTMYWSVLNPNIAKFIQYNNVNVKELFNFRGLQSRTFLLPLASVKYFISTANKEAQTAVPYTFLPAGEIGDFCLYETDVTLPFGYTYDGYISMEDYENMSVVQRQQAMLQGAVMEAVAAAENGLEERTPVYTDVSLPYEIACDANVTADGNRFQVRAENAQVTLTFDCPAECELYAWMEGLNYEGRSPYHYVSEEGWNSLSVSDRIAAKRVLREWTPQTEMVITASSNGSRTSLRHFTGKSRLTTGREDYLWNAYYSQEARTTMTLTFSQPGEYTFEKLSVICQPVDSFESQVNALKRDTMENVEFDANRIAGTIDLGETKLLCLSLPYSQGWTAYVDGEKTELIQTNVMYSGLKVEAGSHTIELVYCTPYLKAGVLISILSAAGVILLAVFQRKFHKRSFR